MNFAKFLRTSFYGTLSDDCSLCLPVILRNFSDHPFYRALLGNCLFHVQVAEFQPPNTIKSISQVLFKYFTRDVLFGGVHLLKIHENYLWISIAMTMTME